MGGEAKAIRCGHCRAGRSNLHYFTEAAPGDGTFEIVRCLLCGWRASRLIPRKQRPLPKVEVLLFEEEKNALEEQFTKYASKAFKNHHPYHGPCF